MFDKLYKDPEYKIVGECEHTKEKYYTKEFTISHCWIFGLDRKKEQMLRVQGVFQLLYKTKKIVFSQYMEF